MSFIGSFFIFFFCFVCACSASLGTDHLPKARNVRWESHNFKSILKWGPKPSNYSYTVQFSRVGRNRLTNRHCIRSQDTECDLTNDLKGLKDCYTADVLTEPLPGFSTDLVELPFTLSKKFCPYLETKIGKPEFTIQLNENKTVVLHIQDQFTALQREGNALTIRDIFKQDLKYKIVYNKAGSTGKKEKEADGDEVEMSELDEGESYCFSIAAYIPSRKEAKLGNWSLPKCSSAEARSIFEVYSWWVIGGGLLILVLFLVIVVVLIVSCCRCRQRGEKAKHSEVLTQV